MEDSMFDVVKTQNYANCSFALTCQEKKNQTKKREGAGDDDSSY